MFGPSSPSNSLKICLDEKAFFLRPSLDPENVPSDDPLIRGSLILSLSKPKRIKSLVVQLVCHYTIETGPDEYRSEFGRHTVAEVFLQDDSVERVYVKGEHTFLFTLIAPSSTPPYERCLHGRFEHKLIAIAEGEGYLNPNIESSVPVLLIVNPAPVGETLDHNVSRDGFREELGPYSISTTSQHLTVGGLVSFEYYLASVPTTLNIVSTSAFLTTEYQIGTMQHPETRTKRSVRRTLLFELSDRRHTNPPDTCIEAKDKDGNALKPEPPYSPSTDTRFQDTTPLGPIQVIPPGGSFRVAHCGRFPPDTSIRPSTVAGSKTPIEIKHELVLRLQFSRVLGEESPSLGKVGRTGPSLVLTVAYPIILSSCCCTLPSLLIPPYEEASGTKVLPDCGCYGNPPAPYSAIAARSPCKDCVCTFSKAELIELGRKADARFVSCPQLGRRSRESPSTNIINGPVKT